jgi:hypothetical protein
MGISSNFAFHKELALTHIRLEQLEDDIGGMKHDMREMKHMMWLYWRNKALQMIGLTKTSEVSNSHTSIFSKHSD